MCVLFLVFASNIFPFSYSCCRCHTLSFHCFVPLASSGQHPKRLSVTGPDSVIHKNVQRRIDIGKRLQDPQSAQIEVVVATSDVHFRTKSQTKRNMALGKTHTTKNTAMPINILVSANSCGEIDDDDNDERPPAEEIPARHAAAW